MNLTNEFMMLLTATMPMKQISIGDKPYLQRYFAYELKHIDIWIHRFLSADGERHVHSHPFEFVTGVLLGGYKEEMLSPDGDKLIIDRNAVDVNQLELIDFILGDCNISLFSQLRNIGLYDWHRIAEVQPETWTIMLVDKRRLKTWHFLGDDGSIETRMSSPRDWYKQYKPRGQNEGDVINV